MFVFLRLRASLLVGAIAVLISFAVALETARGQAGGIGGRGGQTGTAVPITSRTAVPVTSVTTVPITSGVPTAPPQPAYAKPVVEPNSSLARGLEASGRALRAGMGRPDRDQASNVAPQTQQSGGLFPRIQGRIDSIGNGGPVFPRLSNGFGKKN